MNKPDQPHNAFWPLFLLFLAVVVIVGLSGWLFYDAETTHARKAAEDQLNVIADLKTSQITAWRRERLDDARAISTDAVDIHHVHEFLEHAGQTVAGDDIRAWMSNILTTNDYRNIGLIDANYTIRLWAGAGELPHPMHKLDEAAKAIQDCRPMLGDFHWSDSGSNIHLDLYAPIPSRFGAEAGEKCVGALVLVIDPTRFLYPLIQTWPTPSASGEILLIRREDRQVQFLNELRHRKNTAMSLRFSIDEPKLPAAMAARGKEGLIEGIDYRGVRTIAALRTIPDSSWHLIAKTDLDEIYAPFRSWAQVAVASLAGGLFIIGMGYGRWWNRREVQICLRQYKVESQRQALAHRYELLTRHANDIIFHTDADHRITEANERACSAYGYSHEEFIGISISRLRPLQVRAQLQDQLDRADREAGLVHESPQQRKDGSVFPAEVSVRAVELDGAKYYQFILRDITERKHAEEQLLALNSKLEQRARQLRAMASALTSAEDRERRRIAQILHDHLQQLLVGAKFSTATCLYNTQHPKIQQALNQVMELLNQCIETSRSLTAELIPPILSDGGLAEALRWLARWMKEKQGLKVNLQLEEGIDTDRDTSTLLFQATRELLFNVVKHAGVNQAEVCLERQGPDHVEIIVNDDGGGFDMLQDEKGKNTGGFGILSLRERLEWIGGRLEFKTAPGHGTRVRVLAPIIRDSKTETSSPGASSNYGPSAEPSSVRVLLADDHRIVREGLARLLGESADIQIVGEAEDGQEAVNLARQLRPDVVIMDISMPRMNGIDATRIITAERPECRVIGLSMHQKSDMEKAMREAGAVAYLPKDGPAEALIDQIRSISSAGLL